MFPSVSLLLDFYGDLLTLKHGKTAFFKQCRDHNVHGDPLCFSTYCSDPLMTVHTMDLPLFTLMFHFCSAKVSIHSGMSCLHVVSLTCMLPTMEVASCIVLHF